MFPLGSVLFPHMPLPLRLFEPRYLQMLGVLLEDPDPQFGVVLIERGQEVGGGDHRFGIGTMARVVQVVAEADSMTVVAVGDQRLRVREWLPDDPFPQAEVAPLPALHWDIELTDLRQQVEQAVRKALEVSPQAQYSAEVELADEPEAACWQMAAITPVGPLDQLELLRVGSMRELLTLTGELAEDVAQLNW